MDLAGLIALETDIWQALQRGDPIVDNELLAADFLGVYPTGFADKADHVGQLANGPTVTEFAIRDPRFLGLSDSIALLAYRAEYRRSGADEVEEMYVSSLWSCHNGRWTNAFSQDTPVDPAAVVP